MKKIFIFLILSILFTNNLSAKTKKYDNSLLSFNAWLLENGYDKNMGARPMQRLIQDTIKTVLAEEILFGKLSKAGGVASITLEGGEIKVNLTENSKKKEKV